MSDSIGWVTPRVDEVGEVAEIDCHQDVGGRVLALGGDALRQAGVDEDGVDGDAGVPGEGLEQRLDEPGLAGGVEIHLVGGRSRDGNQCHAGKQDKTPKRHVTHHQ